jgi:hypothetical protein
MTLSRVAVGGGDAFEVKDVAQMSTVVLPKYFKRENASTYTRVARLPATQAD